MTHQIQPPVQNKVETDYIDSLLGSVCEEVVSSEDTVKTCLLDTKPQVEDLDTTQAVVTTESVTPDPLTANTLTEETAKIETVTAESVTAETVTTETVALGKESVEKVIDDSLYQLVLVGNIKLAIPLSEITQTLDSSVVTVQNNIFSHNNESFFIVNLNELIGREDESTDDTNNSKQYLLIQHRQLAIECQKIIEVEKIDEAFVCWRSENSQRRWLAGTAKEVGVAILDLANIEQMLLQ